MTTYKREKVVTFWKKGHHLQEEHGHERINTIRNLGVEKSELEWKKKDSCPSRSTNLKQI
jgi:hypothetical protein